MNIIKKMIKSMASADERIIAESMKANQQVLVRLDVSPHTFTTRIDSIDKENIYVAGISDEELHFSLPVPDQKIEIHVFTESLLCKTDTTFRRKMSHPVHLWVLSRPKKVKCYSERRKTYRFEHAIDVTFKISDEVLRDESSAVTKNISIGGLAVVSPVNLPLGEKIKLRLPELRDLQVMGEVAWKYQRPFSDKWYYGVKFVNADESKENFISSYINEKIRKLKWSGLE